jgi:hypothetical protein
VTAAEFEEGRELGVVGTMPLRRLMILPAAHYCGSDNDKVQQNLSGVQDCGLQLLVMPHLRSSREAVAPNKDSASRHTPARASSCALRSGSAQLCSSSSSQLMKSREKSGPPFDCCSRSTALLIPANSSNSTCNRCCTRCQRILQTQLRNSRL